MEKVNHCVDCCCERSWKALGITTYTGMSIDEHITILRSALNVANERVRELEAIRERVVLWAQDAYIDPDSGPDECRGAGCFLTDETCRELVAILAGGEKEYGI